jgi:thioredoxin 1
MTKNLDVNSFKELIFDYTKGNEWKFKGDRPAVIDFYADWCGPCKLMAPIFEELSEQYIGFVDFYKVDTDVQIDLAREFQISSIPALLFIPMDGMPEMAVGALPKADIEEAIKKFI